MTVKSIRFANNFTASSPGNIQRLPSDSVWYDCPLDDFIERQNGTVFFDDFVMAGQPTLNAKSSIGQWACWADTGSSFIDAGQEGSVLQIANTTQGDQVTMASNAGSFRMVSGATGFPLQAKLWFECRVATSSITTATSDFFVGLCDNTTTQIASQQATVIATAGNTLITVPNLFGFHKRATTNPTDVGLAFNVAGGTVQYPTNLQTLVNTVTGSPLTAYATVANGPSTGFVKLGFVYDPNAQPVLLGSTVSTGQTASVIARPLIKIFVNGLLSNVYLTSVNAQAATFPTGYMSPVIAYNCRTGNAILYMDWIMVAQAQDF